jgi:hypothetical protein
MSFVAWVSQMPGMRMENNVHDMVRIMGVASVDVTMKQKAMSHAMRRSAATRRRSV